MKKSILKLLLPFLATIQHLSLAKHSSGKHSYKNDPTHLYVHLVPHTHDDVGWLKTVDQYFTGTNISSHTGFVEMILDTVIDELIDDPNKRFTYVEMKFFTMWWNEQPADIQQSVKQLVKNGQLEFVNGGWSMHDEACPSYEDMIDNMMHGQKFLYDTFQVKPRIGWQIDPFGHSATNARLFAEMGFDAMFTSRIDFQERAKRVEEQSMTFLWRPQFKHLGKSSQILHHVLPYDYCSLDYFGYDPLDFDNINGPFVDDPDLQTFNADWKADLFIKNVTEIKKMYKVNHILVPTGCDFNYQNAHQNFRSIDKMIKYINDKFSNVTLMYSTPGKFLDAIIQADISFPTRYDDMFPYQSEQDNFWTGFYSSRAPLKKQIKEGSALFHSTLRHLSYQAISLKTNQDTINNIKAATDKMFDAMGLLQHHDAVTGTNPPHVNENYAWKLSKGKSQLQSLLLERAQLMGIDVGNVNSTQWSMCTLTNTSYLDCPNKSYKNSTFLVLANNPSTHSRYYIKVKTPHNKFIATLYNQTAGDFVNVRQTILCHNYTDENYKITQDCDLHIEVEIAALETALVQISYNYEMDKHPELQPNKKVPIEASLQRYSYLAENIRGSLFRINMKDGQYEYIGAQLRYYISQIGQYEGKDGEAQGSNAYIFTPSNNTPSSLPYFSSKPRVVDFSNEFMQETVFYFDNDLNKLHRGARIIVRAFEKSPMIEYDVQLYPVPLENSTVYEGKEVTMNFFAFNFTNTNGKFYTDSNNLEMQERKYNFRNDYTLHTSLTVPSNYYPVNQAISMRDIDQNLQLTIMNDRAQGGGVVETGRIELMHYRRLFINERVDINENGSNGQGVPIQATYYLQYFNMKQETSFQRNQMLSIDYPLTYYFTNQWQDLNSKNSQDKIKLSQIITSSVKYNSYQDVQAPLNMLVYPLDLMSLLIRFENLADLYDYPSNSTLNDTNIEIDVNQVALDLYLAVNGKDAQVPKIDIVELEISGILSVEDMISKKVNWKGDDDDKIVPPKIPQDKDQFVISLSAQRIRQFKVIYSQKTGKHHQFLQSK
eukprot:403353533